MILALAGCQSGDVEESLTPEDITTFDEVIEDGKVEIDGISYTIESVSKSTYEYDDEGNIIERINENNNKKIRTEFIYNENNDVLEEKSYSEGSLIATRSYSYEEDALKEVKIAYESGFEMLTEYSYEEDKEIVTSYNTDGSVALTAIIYKDENGNNSKMVQSSPEVEKLKATTNYEYENDLLIKVTTERSDTNTTAHYEYNNVGDKTMEYHITILDDLYFLDASFFEYEYNDKLQPISLTIYRVNSPIEEEDIREFE
jgi:YD repeat-containing protein